MRRNIYSLLRTLVLFLYLLSLLCSCAFLDELFPPEQGILGSGPSKIVYIYEVDKEDALDFALFLDQRGYRTEIIPLSAVTTIDFSLYKLIIIGADTGSGYNWGTPEGVQAIENSEKPVIGLGAGGTSLFQNLLLSINYGNSKFFNDNHLYIINAYHIIFCKPNPLSISDYGTIQVCNNGVSIGIYEGNLMSYVVTYARSVEYPNHSPLVQEDRYLLWGFSSPPADMTGSGKDLFINIVSYLTTT